MLSHRGIDTCNTCGGRTYPLAQSWVCDRCDGITSAAKPECGPHLAYAWTLAGYQGIGDECYLFDRPPIDGTHFVGEVVCLTKSPIWKSGTWRGVGCVEAVCFRLRATAEMYTRRTGKLAAWLPGGGQ